MLTFPRGEWLERKKEECSCDHQETASETKVVYIRREQSVPSIQKPPRIKLSSESPLIASVPKDEAAIVLQLSDSFSYSLCTSSVDYLTLYHHSQSALQWELIRAI